MRFVGAVVIMILRLSWWVSHTVGWGVGHGAGSAVAGGPGEG